MASPGRLLRSARLIALLTLGSRILGVIRECIFSHYFGTSSLLSAFRIAWVVPNLARRLFGEGALSAATIPVLTASLTKQGNKASRQFIGSLFTILVTVLGIGVLAGEGVVALWRALTPDPAVTLLAILLPYTVLICLVAVASGVLQVRGHFAIPAAAPMMLNLAIIVGTLAGSYGFGLDGIALMKLLCGCILIAGVFQVAFTGIALCHVSFFPIFSGAWRDPKIRKVLALMAPMVLGLSAIQINSLADYLIAYFFIDVDGVRVGPAVLGYAQYLYQLPLGVFGIAIATAIFPILSERAAREDRVGVAETIGRGLRMGWFIALPATVGLIGVAKPLVAALYENGQFGADSTQRVAGTLVFYSLGLSAYFAQHIIVRAFYAFHESRTPARITVRMVGLNVAMNMSLVFVMQERGLALSTAITALIQAVWLSQAVTRQVPGIAWRQIAGAAGKVLLATAAMGAALLILNTPTLAGGWMPVRPAFRVATLVSVGVAVYGLLCYLLKIQEVHLLLPGLSKRKTETTQE